MLSTIYPRRRLAALVSTALLLICIARDSNAQAELTGRITLANGDTLKGQLRFIDSGGHLAWQHPLVGSAIIFELHNVRDVVMPKSQVQLPNELMQLLRLKNGDEVRGTLQALDAETATFMALTAGPLTLPRRHLVGLDLDILPRGLTYKGPNSIDEWVTKSLDVKSPWTFRNGGLYAHALDPVGRMVDLPRRASIEFDAASPGAPMMRLTFYASQLHHSNGPGYYLLIGQKDIFLGRQGAGLTGNDTSPGIHYKFDLSGKTTIRILTDLERRELVLLIGGVVVDRWTSPGDVTPSGKGIVFAPQSRNDLALSNIRVSRWSGRIPSPPSNALPSSHDRIRFANGDVVDGAIVSIGTNGVVLQTSAQTIDIPFNRVSQLQFAQRQVPDDAPATGLTQIGLLDGSRISLKLSSVNGQTLTGDIPGGASLSIPAVFVRELNFKHGRKTP